MIGKVLLSAAAIAACCLSAPLHASDLGHLKGIKWKQQLPARGGEFNDMVYGRLDRPKDSNGEFITWDRLATQLKQKGVEAVSFRIDREDRYIDENDNGPADEMAAYHDELRLMTSKLKDKGIEVYLFARIWLTTKDNDFVFDRFNSYLSSLTEAERNLIDGIALTETHLSDFGKIKTRARWIPSKFENAYPGWLKQRAFIMPGLDMGFRFNGVNQNDDFHQLMDNAVGEFAFSVKSMKLKTSNDPERLYADFSKYLQWQGQSLSARENYIGETLGLNELIAYQDNASTQYPHLANIVFWGDSGDSLSNIHPKGAQAVHNVLTQSSNRGNYKTTFMYAGVGGTSQIDDPNEPNDIERVFAKSVIVYDEQTDTHARHDIEFGYWENVLGTYDQWAQWASNNYMNKSNPDIYLASNREVLDAAEQSYTLTVYSNMYWQLTNVPEWVTLDYDQGSGDGQVVLTVSANEQWQSRQATLRVNDIEFELEQRGIDVSDDFESGGLTGGNGWAGDWVLTKHASVSAQGAAHGDFNLRLVKNGKAVRRMDVSTASNLTLGFSVAASSLDSASEYGLVELFDGSVWHELYRLEGGAGDQAYRDVSVDLSGFTYTGTEQRLRVRLNGNGQGDYFYVDNIRLGR